MCTQTYPSFGKLPGTEPGRAPPGSPPPGRGIPPTPEPGMLNPGKPDGAAGEAGVAGLFSDSSVPSVNCELGGRRGRTFSLIRFISSGSAAFALNMHAFVHSSSFAFCSSVSG